MSLRDKLRGRSLPTEVVRLPADSAEYARRERALAVAQWTLDEARGRGIDTAGLRARTADTQTALDACPVIEVTVRALPPEEWEALIELYPATDDQQSRGMQWNATTFRPAMLEACVVPPPDEKDPMTADDWAQVVKNGELTAGEYNTLCNAAVQLNLRGPASAVGKES